MEELPLCPVIKHRGAQRREEEAQGPATGLRGTEKRWGEFQLVEQGGEQE